MNDKFKEFLETFDSSNTARVIKSLQTIGDYDYANYTIEDVEEIILELKPNSLKAITTICYVMGLYAKYLEDDNLYSIVQEIDRNSVWIKAKPSANKKFVSNSDFQTVYHDIGMYEEFNAFYHQELFRCVYEGIYNDDMSVVKNLKASDVNGNVVTLRPDNGDPYELEISTELAENLKELGDLDTWDRKNRSSVFQMKINGLNPDSCFKTENRKESSEYSYRYTYYRILRKISKEYLEYNLLPLELFVSGMMYRIGLKLKEHNIDIEDAFADHNRDRLVKQIIANELKRCNYNVKVNNFREIVKGHLEIFHIIG